MINATNFHPHTLSQPPRSAGCQAVNRVLWQTLGINLLVAGAKIIVGLLTGTISMLADGFHSAMDASANIIGLIGSMIAHRPADSNHPYGHQKYETFATLAIGFLLLLTSWNVLKSVFARLIDGTHPEITALSFAVILITIVLNLIVAAYEKKERPTAQ